MFRYLAICFVGLLYYTQAPPLLAQVHDPRLDKLAMEFDKLAAETDGLKHTIADQDKRIMELEKSVKMLQSAAAPPPPEPIPAPTPPWKAPSSWKLIQAGMSEAQVVGILGPPTSVQSVEDSRTLFYQPDASSTSTLNGSVTLKDDRVTASSPPAF
jgi:hypothetical protein